MRWSLNKNSHLFWYSSRAKGAPGGVSKNTLINLDFCLSAPRFFFLGWRVQSYGKLHLSLPTFSEDYKMAAWGLSLTCLGLETTPSLKILGSFHLSLCEKNSKLNYFRTLEKMGSGDNNSQAPLLKSTPLSLKSMVKCLLKDHQKGW